MAQEELRRLRRGEERPQPGQDHHRAGGDAHAGETIRQGVPGREEPRGGDHRQDDPGARRHHLVPHQQRPRAVVGGHFRGHRRIGDIVEGEGRAGDDVEADQQGDLGHRCQIDRHQEDEREEQAECRPAKQQVRAAAAHPAGRAVGDRADERVDRGIPQPRDQQGHPRQRRTDSLRLGQIVQHVRHRDADVGGNADLADRPAYRDLLGKARFLGLVVHPLSPFVSLGRDIMM